jgi:hypothetical protein
LIAATVEELSGRAHIVVPDAVRGAAPAVRSAKVDVHAQAISRKGSNPREIVRTRANATTQVCGRVAGSHPLDSLG